jgi:MEMO1 family protein
MHVLTRRSARRAFALLIGLLAIQPWSLPLAGAAAEVREPAVAGDFYPASGSRLTAALNALLQDAVPPRPERPIAIVVPHAAYVYSGQIAADAFRQASQHQYDTIVIVGTAHTGSALGKIAVYPGAAFRTPLGTIAVDEAFRSDLLRQDPDCVADARAHAREHSIEVQVPFVQRLFPTAKIVPIVVAEADPVVYARLGQVLARLSKNRQVLVVASSDLSHYPPAKDAIETDRRTLESVAALDASRLLNTNSQDMKRAVPKLVTCACGDGAIAAVIAAAVALGATRGTVVSYANSGDILVGDSSSVVGYGSVVMTSGDRGSDVTALARPTAIDASAPLQAQDKEALLRMAREAISRFLTTETVPRTPLDNPRLMRSRGVFVTLRERGELRGCIGQIGPDAPLIQLTGRMALAAATSDPRFPKVRTDEMNRILIEVSVLTEPMPVPAAAAIVLGRDGVILNKNGRSAVFLPSVATEQGWDRTQLLDNLALKAGLPQDAWRSGAQLLVFQAEVFAEKTPQLTLHK